MGAYNKYKDQQCCHNKYLLIDILRNEWGFDGTVVSDWGGVHDTRQAITNGLDLEFGSWTDGMKTSTSNAYDNYYLARPYLELIHKGEFTTKELDDKVRHILRLVFRTSMNRNRPYGSLGSPEHSAAGRKVAEEGIVLLQNKNNVLPIDLGKAKKIAVIGENAIKRMTVGGGSSSLKSKYEITPLEGLKRHIGNRAEIVFARGYVGAPKEDFDGVGAQDLSDNRSEADLIAEACRVAKSADYVIYFGGLNKSEYQDSEGTDRKGLELPYNQDHLITELAKANKNLVVVNISGNAVAMPWINVVPAIVQSWYLGSENGNALADILTGDANPSGKLPFTFPVKLSDSPAHSKGEFPGKNGQVNYSEGIYVGYRWFEKEKIKPLFAFGYGLSYTTFEYGKITADKKEMTASDKITFNVEVKNTGKREGSETVQLYITDVKSSVDRPVKELKGFEKVSLQPGETKTVSITIDASALSYFDAGKHQWAAEPGEFTASIGAASNNIKGKVNFTLK